MPRTPSTHRASINRSPTTDPMESDVADRVAADIRAIPGVAGLHAGRFGEVALLYPRHRVNGLRVSPTALEVHLIVDLAAPRPLAEIAAEVRAVVAGFLDTEVDVFFADATGGPRE
ncbi:hypothetical protein NYP18_02195 [Corynebacterium sp. YIM 101645]|uniref:Asp23/Gls24 family envelope stress response protein n=1 Tax=Corynebacterium lemuris TaxID=1859292 RepID=A0ABT2FTA8_9CORY|nr:hypothetical protein [Corynebacterium lemuris]MCS5478457.1 hypothetical protein [Corynebacterium lemuris]